MLFYSISYRTVMTFTLKNPDEVFGPEKNEVIFESFKKKSREYPGF